MTVTRLQHEWGIVVLSIDPPFDIAKTMAATDLFRLAATFLSF